MQFLIVILLAAISILSSSTFAGELELLPYNPDNAVILKWVPGPDGTLVYVDVNRIVKKKLPLPGTPIPPTQNVPAPLPAPKVIPSTVCRFVPRHPIPGNPDDAVILLRVPGANGNFIYRNKFTGEEFAEVIAPRAGALKTAQTVTKPLSAVCKNGCTVVTEVGPTLATSLLIAGSIVEVGDGIQDMAHDLSSLEEIEEYGKEVYEQKYQSCIRERNPVAECAKLAEMTRLAVVNPLVQELIDENLDEGLNGSLWIQLYKGLNYAFFCGPQYTGGR